MNRDIVLAAILLVAICLASVAFGHDWYDAECCNGTDCFPVAIDDVTETETGWIYRPTGNVFSRQQARPSRDRNVHVCIRNGRSLCIYTIQGASLNYRQEARR